MYRSFSAVFEHVYLIMFGRFLNLGEQDSRLIMVKMEHVNISGRKILTVHH